MSRIISGRKVGGPDGPLAYVTPFRTHGALFAVMEDYPLYGRLPAEWRAKYRADILSPGVRYTVVSYQTPIAWVLADGAVVIPDVTYSLTTTRHQGQCRAWLAAGKCYLCRRVGHSIAEQCWI
jgi:hypothetical protein